MKRIALGIVAVLVAAGCAAANEIQSGASPTPSATQGSTEGVPGTAFKAFTLKGRGNKVAKIKLANDAIAIAAISHRGRANFVVATIDKSGSQSDLLVNEIGNYKGTRLFNADESEGTKALKIEADGSWSIAVKPVAQSRKWSGGGRVTGTGSDVLIYGRKAEGIATVRITHKGEANFVVLAYSTETGRELLVNEIGRYSGESLLPAGTVLLSVEADGAWTISPT
jgi:hypothetical protein